MNRTIRHTAIFALVLVLALLANLTYVQAFTEDRYAHNALNRRQFFETKAIPRGQISAGGLVLAQSTANQEGQYNRSYQNNPVTVGPVVGYLSDVYGASGLEEFYNDILNGTDASLTGRRVLDQLAGKKPQGANLELTINPKVQQVAYDQLASQGYEGAAVAIRPSTGEVLAMASTPSFDPNQIVNPATSQDAWSKLNTDPGAPLLNHATQEPLPPGSTFKVITTAAGLDAGYNPNSTVTAAPTITLPNTNTQLENYDGSRCAPGDTTTLSQAFAKSCNTAFVQMGIDAGRDRMLKAAKSFGVGQAYDLGLPVEKGSLGDIPDDAALGQTSIGQRDVTMSVLQNAVIAATIANKGKRMEPHVVSKVLGSNLKPVSTTKPKELNQAIPEDQANTIKGLMQGSEHATSGYAGQDIASKTGTAEHGDPANPVPPHVWYIAFGPSENADVAVAVVVKDGGHLGQKATGGAVAAPIGRAIIQAALGSQ